MSGAIERPRRRSFAADEIARLLEGRLDASAGAEIPPAVDGVGDLASAGALDVAVVFDAVRGETARASDAGLLVAPAGVELGARAVVRVGNPRAALVVLLELFHPRERRAPGVEVGARVAPGARLGEGVFVAAGATVEDGASLGCGVEIHAGAVVGRGVEIGDESILHPNVVVHSGTRLGARVEIHAGSVIGRPGFGYLREDDGRQRRIPQVGRVEIEDDVEVGALCAIDRATLGVTRIRRGTKIDNLVQIAHNSDIGEDCCLAAQVGVSGSVEVGARSVLLGQVGVADHSRLAPETIVGAQSGVVGRVGPGEWIGYPAIPAPLARRAYGLLAKLPELFRELRRLRRAVDEPSSRDAG